MEFSNLKAALGRSADLGSFYDARLESFIPGNNLFKKTVPNNLITTIETTKTDFSYDFEDTMSSKLKNLNVNAELKISALAGLLKLEGSGKYLDEEKTSFKSVKATIIYKCQTKKQSINLNENEFKEIVSVESLANRNNIGTHVVVGIDWGVNVIFIFEHKNSQNKDKNEIIGAFDGSFSKLNISGEAKMDFNNNSEKSSNEFTFKFLGDVSLDYLPKTWEEAQNLTSQINSSIKANEGKGVPLQYHLMPLEEVVKKFNIKIKIDIVLKNIEELIIKNVHDEYEKFNQMKQKFNDFCEEVDTNFFNSKELEHLDILKKNIALYECNFKTELQRALINVRSGKEDSSVLNVLVEKFIGTSSNSIKNFLDDNLFRKRMKKINEFKSDGFIYLKKNSSLSGLRTNKKPKIFVLIFSDSMKEKNKDEWNENYELFLRCKAEYKDEKSSEFYLCDLGIHQDEDDIKKICIHFYEDGDCIKDYYETKKDLLTKALAKSSSFDYTLVRPFNYGIVSLRCPNWKNGCPRTELNWICEKCKTNFQYGYDSKIYCDCGGGDYHTFEFKCPDKRHQNRGFIKYEIMEMQKLLGIKVTLKNEKNETYDGEVRNDKKYGKGTFHYFNGEKYEGDWKDDKINGRGTYYWPNGIKYEGDCKDNKREGKGTIYWPNGDKYEGDWKDNKREGKGTCYWTNGDKYEGDWKDDKREGKGTYYWPSGKKYEGYWKDDKREGKGCRYNSNGKKEYEGDWKDDKPVENCQVM